MGKLSIKRLKYATSPGYEVRPKNKSIWKCKKWHCAKGVHGHCSADWFRQVQTSLDKSEHVWSAIFLNHEKHAVQIWSSPQTCMQFSKRPSLETLWHSEVEETALHHASIGVRCELVWSATFLGSTSKNDIIIRKLLLSQVGMWNFTRIGPKTKKFWLLIVPALMRSYQPHLGQPQKGVNRNFSWPHFSLTSYPGEIAYFNSPNRQLSNGARVMELYWNRNVDPSRGPCLKAIDRKSFKCGNFLVLHPALLKIAYFKSGNRQLSIDVLLKERRQRKFVDPSRGAP